MALETPVRPVSPPSVLYDYEWDVAVSSALTEPKNYRGSLKVSLHQISRKHTDGDKSSRHRCLVGYLLTPTLLPSLSFYCFSFPLFCLTR